MDFSWMAWTWPTAAFFIFVATCIGTMTIWEIMRPGGGARRGIFLIDTTRGDRLFISILGSAFIFLGWLALVGTPLWGALAIAIAWFFIVFRWV